MVNIECKYVGVFAARNDMFLFPTCGDDGLVVSLSGWICNNIGCYFVKFADLNDCL